MSWFARLAALVLLALAPVVHAAEAAAVASPDGKIRVSIDVDGEGHVRYSVARGTAALITPSWLGFLLTDAPKLHRNLSVTGSETRSFDETWTQPWGERTRVRNHFNELRVHIKETKPLARGSIQVQVRGGTLVGLGSACPFNKHSYLDSETDTYYGEALAIVRMGDGDAMTIAASDGEYSAELTVSAQA